MKVETKLRQSLSHRKFPLISRTDVAGIGSQTQVTYALNQLIGKGELQRISRGIYFKPQPKVDFDLLVRTTAKKLKFKLSQPDQDYNQLFLNNNNIVKIQIDNSRINRTLVINGRTINFCHTIKKIKTSHQLSIPKNNVAKFVKNLAKKNKISYQLTSLDLFGDAVTRLAGDDIQHDDVKDLIIALQRAGKISVRQLIALNTNYLRETR